MSIFSLKSWPVPYFNIICILLASSQPVLAQDNQTLQLVLQPLIEATFPVSEPVHKTFKPVELTSSEVPFEWSDFEIQKEAILETDLIKLKMSLGFVPGPRRQSLVFLVAQIYTESTAEWQYLASRNYGDWSDAPYVSLFNSDLLSLVTKFDEAKIGLWIDHWYLVTLDAGRTWQGWRPSMNWSYLKPGDPQLGLFEMSSEGVGKVVYYSAITPIYTFITTDKGLTWLLVIDSEQ